MPERRSYSNHHVSQVICVAIAAFVALPCTTLVAQDGLPEDLTELSLEHLMSIEVTSVSRKAQPLSEAAAAIYVLSNEDIRRSGVATIPDALRLVPGLQVAQLDANKWAISSRGFNGRFANKLLVLIDGRTVYTTLFSGVFWDTQNVVLEDIDRIEVIRGPGATLWGANAVNGVINIVTRKASETQGGLVVAGGGTEERGFGTVRFGGELSPTAHYRVYVKYHDRDGAVDSSGDDTFDGTDVLQGGFRIDWESRRTDVFTLQGDIYHEDYEETLTGVSLLPPFAVMKDEHSTASGGNILGRWTHTFSTDSDMSVQAYYDRTERDSGVLDDVRDTIDIDAQHRFALGPRQEILWGLGYRYTSDELDGSFDVSFDPESRNDDLFSAFIQDEITLAENLWRLTIGSKFEHNDYTGFEVQPSARLLWTPDEKNTWWTAVSRAVRTPSRAEHDVRLNNAVIPPGGVAPGSPTTLVALLGDDDFDSEELIAYELGYRVQVNPRAKVDVATFYNVYDNLRTLEPGLPFAEFTPPPPHLTLPAFGDNLMEGETYGIEIAGEWHVNDRWKLIGTYTHLHIDLQPDSDSLDPTSESPEGESPHNQFSLQSRLNVSETLQFDSILRYVDNLASMGVPSYTELDLRLSWRPVTNMEIALVGQNLLDDHHSEFTPSLVNTLPSEIQRSVYGKVTWTF